MARSRKRKAAPRISVAVTQTQIDEAILAIPAIA